jgi:hypothetical protein
MRTNQRASSHRPHKRLTDAVNRKERSSDQAPGEEVVQVNDKYVGGGPPPSKLPVDDDKHLTGG